MKNLLKIQKKLKINFKNTNLLVSALTHKSANSKNNNEKLEFLGDRVLGLVLSKKLFDLYPDVSEGILDKRFANLVKKETCCDIAWSIGIQDYVIIGNKKKRITKNDSRILSDACEALIGAIYLDRGINFVENYILKIWKKKIDISNNTILDSKTKLQEYSLKKYKRLPVYEVINFIGPKHNPTYNISVFIIGSKKFIGSGNSKQQAEQDGALKLIKSIGIK